jgi:hypothetical protein
MTALEWVRVYPPRLSEREILAAGAMPMLY